MNLPPAAVLIGLDDTDNASSPGTGRLARQLSAECARRGLRPLGVTRHQFLVDPRIPYTSHNSGACVAVEGEGGADAAAFAFDFVAERAADGSDPGVCVASAAVAGPEMVVFGRDAARRIVAREEAEALARLTGAALRPLGGSGLGIIGALASVGGRAGGEGARFIDLPGLRELPERVTFAALERMGIRLRREGGSPGADAEVCATLGWVRPRLAGGLPVLPLLWSDEHDAWVPVDRKHARP